MKRKKLLMRTIGLLLISVGIIVLINQKKESEIVPEEKKPYYITVANFVDLQEHPTIQKNGKLLGEQDITVTSQVSARVTNIPGEIGGKVTKDQLVISLEDNSGVYSFNAQRAATALQQARINYESTKNTLEKSIIDTQLALEQATSQFNNASSTITDSSTMIQIEKADKEIEKAKFDYQTKLQSDQQTIDNLLATTKSLTNDVKILFTNVLTEADKLLGISPIYQSLNDTYENKLGASNTQTRRDAITQLKLGFIAQEYINSLPDTLNQDQLVSQLLNMKSQLDVLTQLLKDIDNMLNNTNGSNELPSSTISTLIATFARLQSTVQATESTLTNQANSTQSFLATYRQQQESLLKSIEIAEQQRDLLIRNLQVTETSTNIGLNSAQSSLETTIKNKGTTEQSLLNAIQQAQITYNEAQNQLAKLQVKAPIAGTIGSIFVDIGQEISPGSPLFTISSTDQPQIEISIGNDELAFIEIGQEVHVDAEGVAYTGTITSISQTANNNFTYQVIILLNNTVDLLGTLAQVEIPTKSDYPLLPINIIEVVNKSTGIIRYLENNQIQQKAVELGDVRGNLIEIRSNHLGDLAIITSNIKNYDPNKFELTIKQE